MNFASSLARALIPVAMVAVASPSAAAEPSADLARLKAHISGVQTMTASFTQTDPRGHSQSGTMQLKRPGKIRFEYSGNDPLIVADGRNLVFLDYSVRQKSVYPLSKTPLAPLLSSSPDFNGKAQILPSSDPRVVVARARNTGQYGQITLAFLRSGSAPGGLQLYGWTAVDPQGRRTTVKLSNVRYNVGVADSAFTYADPKKRRD